MISNSVSNYIAGHENPVRAPRELRGYLARFAIPERLRSEMNRNSAGCGGSEHSVRGRCPLSTMVLPLSCVVQEILSPQPMIATTSHYRHSKWEVTNLPARASAEHPSSRIAAYA